MKTNNNKSTSYASEQSERPFTNPANQTQGFIAPPEVFLSRDGESIIHRLPGNMRIELHVNLYKKILGASFVAKERRPMTGENQPRSRFYGFFAQPDIYLTRDGEYLIHKVLGVRISKHVNFYKQILGIPYQPKSRTPIGAELTEGVDHSDLNESRG